MEKHSIAYVTANLKKSENERKYVPENINITFGVVTGILISKSGKEIPKAWKRNGSKNWYRQYVAIFRLKIFRQLTFGSNN